ncbi:MAG: DUF4097 family beta strand repeat-containing protein [Eubacteriales bacterium]
MNNKVVLKIVAICAVVFLVFGILAAALAIYTIPKKLEEGKWPSFGGNEPFEYYKNEVLDIDGVSKINISTVSTDVVFYQSDKDLEITLDVQGYTRSETLTLETSKNDGVINVKIKYPKYNFGSWGGLNIIRGLLQIGIPASYSENLYVSGVGSNIKINDGISNSFAKLDLVTVSGDVRIDCEKISFIDFESTSGALTVENTLIDTISVDTTSGDISIDNIIGESGNINVSTISGSVKLDYDALCKTKIHTISGDVMLKIPADTKMDLDYSSISGDISGSYSPSSDGITVDVNTTSGDLNIEEN